MDAGELLCQVRQRHGLSQEDLAIRAGVARSVIRDIESGRASPSVQALAELLHVLAEDLVLGSEKRETGIDITLNQGNLTLNAESRVQRGLEFADIVRSNRRGGAKGLGRSLRLGPPLQVLVRHSIDFVVVGSIAGLAYGSAYPTFDLDVAYSRDAGNLARLDSALAELGATDGSICMKEPNLSIESPYGNLDLLGEISGIESYEELSRDSCREQIAGVSVRIASLNHLIAMKRASSQRKDQLMAMEYVQLADELRRREEEDAS